MRKPYDQQSDMWSVYLLLSGNLPFMGRSHKELFRKIVAGKFEFDKEEWTDVSEDAKDLVCKMLVLNPDERIKSSEAIRHQWLKTSRESLNLVNLQGMSQRLMTFRPNEAPQRNDCGRLGQQHPSSECRGFPAGN